MRIKHLIWIIPLCLIIGFMIGIVTYVLVEDNLLMKGYDLYHCIYSNANSNSFPESSYLINKIQEECISFFRK